MESDNFVIVNGQKLDKVTREPITDSPMSQKTTNIVNSNPKRTPVVSRVVRSTGRPNLTRKPGNRMDISRSRKITHFDSSRADKKNSTTKADEQHTKHPIVSLSERRQSLIKSPTKSVKKISAKTSKEIKEQVIKNALEEPSRLTKEKNFFRRHGKAIFIISIILVAISAIYFTYINIPIFSVKVASAQSGINASFPSYYPYGYSIDGPVVYDDNKITIKFKSNTDTTNFEINQTKSTWDSTAVKNMIIEISNDTYHTVEERGLTIYSYNGNAAWVNGGILYEIKGNALLSRDQIRKIATSL